MLVLILVLVELVDMLDEVLDVLIELLVEDVLVDIEVLVDLEVLVDMELDVEEVEMLLDVLLVEVLELVDEVEVVVEDTFVSAKVAMYIPQFWFVTELVSVALYAPVALTILPSTAIVKNELWSCSKLEYPVPAVIVVEPVETRPAPNRISLF